MFAMIRPGRGLSRITVSKRRSTFCGPPPTAATAPPTPVRTETLTTPVDSPSGLVRNGRPLVSVPRTPSRMTRTLPVAVSAKNTRPSTPTSMPRGLFNPLATTVAVGSAAATDGTSERHSMPPARPTARRRGNAHGNSPFQCPRSARIYPAPTEDGPERSAERHGRGARRHRWVAGLGVRPAEGPRRDPDRDDGESGSDRDADPDLWVAPLAVE